MAKIEVSKEFYDIYINFNVCNQIDNMNLLSKKELYFLLVNVLDKFDETDPVVRTNLLPFKDMFMEIYDLMDDSTNEPNIYIKELINETDNKYLECESILYNNTELPKPKSLVEVRDAKINLLNK
jgi:hypothetical protein